MLLFRRVSVSRFIGMLIVMLPKGGGMVDSVREFFEKSWSEPSDLNRIDPIELSRFRSMGDRC
jgi:hypothetical protein